MFHFLKPTAYCPNPRSYAVLLLTVVSYGVVNNVVFSLLPLIGTEVGLTPRQITLIGSCAALVVFLVSPWWGRRSDVWGRRTSILIGVVGYCVSAVLLVGFVTLALHGLLGADWLYAGVFGSRLLQAFLIAAMLPAITAYVIDITEPSQRAVGLGRTGAAHGIGAIAGPSLVVLASWHLLLPLYVAIGLAVLIACLVMRYLVEPVRKDPASRVSGAARKLGYLDVRYRHLLLAGVAIYLGMAVSTQTMGFYLPHVLGVSVADAAQPLGITQAMMAMGTVLGQLVLVPRLAWRPERLMQVGMPLMVLGFLLLAGAVALWQLQLGVVLIGLGLGVSGPGFSASVSLSVDAPEQGAVAGLLAACPALGYVVGPYAAGVLYEWIPAMPFAFAAGVLALVWVILLRVTRGRGVS